MNVKKQQEERLLRRVFWQVCDFKIGRLGLLFCFFLNLSACAIAERLGSAEYMGGSDVSLSPKSIDTDFRYPETSAATNKAIVAFIKGNLEEAERNVRIALISNPDDPYALLIGGIVYEQIGRPNRARQHYEDLLILGATAPSIISGLTIQMPKPIAETARERARMLELTQGGLIIPDKSLGVHQFNILNQPQASNIPNAPTQQQMPQSIINYQQPAMPMQTTAPTSLGLGNEQLLGQNIGDLNQPLFSEDERNTITRFDTFKKLAEEGLITREEFYIRRQANIGALLPQTNGPPASGLERPVPTPSMIVDRLRALRDAFEKRAVTAKEHSAERSLILDALLPAEPRIRAKTPPPPKDMLEGAKELRKLEVLLRMGLITQSEKDLEQQTIERIIKLGLNQYLQEKTAAENNLIAVIGLTPPEMVDDQINEKKKNLS